MRLPRLACALLVPTLPLAVAACAVQAPGGSTSDFRAFLDADWKYWMTAYPEFATSVGYPGQNGRWTDYSPSAIAARAAHVRESAKRLAAIDRGQLGDTDRLNYDLYADLQRSAIEGLAFHYDAAQIRGTVPSSLLMPIDQLEGIPEDVPRTIALMQSATREDFENIVSRLRGVAPLVDQTIALMEQGLTAGMTPPRVALRDVPDQVRTELVEDPFTSPLLAAFGRFPSGLTEPERTDLRTRAAGAYRDQVAPALRKLHEFLVSRYVPRCRETTGAGALPNGAALYAYNVRWHVTTGQTPDEIHAIGLSEVKRIRAEMDDVIKSLGFAGTYEKFKHFVQTDPRFFYKDAESLLTGYRDIAKRADPELARLFGRLPQTPYGVIPVPTAVAPSQTTAYYEQGALAVGRPAYMFANTYKLDARPRWEMEALTLHEAVPGHHMQIALAQEMEGLPEFRQNASYTAFVEGWGLYAEHLGEEMGFYADPYAKFGQLTYQMWRAVRLVIDTGLHAKGWTRDQALAFFRENAAKTDQDITVEVDRYIVWPGQALGYKMGERKILELRARAERALGPKFDVRQFHDVVLGQGAVPLDILEQRVGAWLQKAGAGSAPVH